MKLEAKREHLLKPLQHVIGAVERRQTLPILTNVLLTATERELTLTATDLEVELSVRVELPVEVPGEITPVSYTHLDVYKRQLNKKCILAF